MPGSRRGPSSASEAYSAAYQEFVRPFVYRRYLDFGVFESLRDMKALIAREVSRRELDQHLKLGRGGIREIEFIVQSMQLVRGGSDRRLQSASLLEVLPLLAGSKLMSAADIAELTDAYLVLRKAENALQMIRDEQTHSLPDDARGSRALERDHGAAGLGRGQRAHRRRARQRGAAIRGAAVRRRRTRSIVTTRWARHGSTRDDAKIDEELASGGFPQRRNRGGRRDLGVLSARGALSAPG